MGKGESPGDDPNTIQIGGTHYSSEYQVWDFTEKHGLGHLESCIVKYMCRWREKGNGEVDLEKATHYVDKLIDLHKHNGRVPNGCASVDDALDFCTMQDLDVEEEFVVTTISRWSCSEELAACRASIQTLIAGGE